MIWIFLTTFLLSLNHPYLSQRKYPLPTPWEHLHVFRHHPGSEHLGTGEINGTGICRVLGIMTTWAGLKHAKICRLEVVTAYLHDEYLPACMQECRQVLSEAWMKLHIKQNRSLCTALHKIDLDGYNVTFGIANMILTIIKHLLIIYIHKITLSITSLDKKDIQLSSNWFIPSTSPPPPPPPCCPACPSGCQCTWWLQGWCPAGLHCLWWTRWVSTFSTCNEKKLSTSANVTRWSQSSRCVYHLIIILTCQKNKDS